MFDIRPFDFVVSFEDGEEGITREGMSACDDQDSEPLSVGWPAGRPVPSLTICPVVVRYIFLRHRDSTSLAVNRWFGILSL
jgi:hypothetical protein